MSLQVWLPLNKEGNFLNQGLADITITNNGATYDSNGKIGGCYKTNRNNITFPSLSCMEMKHGKSFSLFNWVKGTTTGWLYACTAFELRMCPNFIQVHNGGSGSNYAARYNGTFDTNVWYHLGFTWDGENNILKLYLNGVLVAEDKNKTITNFNIKPIFYISYDGPRYLNDFRIYDHCLSPKEVHEIAKGLVLHYPMNDEYVESTTNLGNTSATYSNIIFGKEYIASSWGGDAGTVTYYESGGFNNLPYKVYHKTATGDGGIYNKTANDIILEANKTYTMSIWIKASRNFSDSSYSFNINRGSDNYYINYGLSVKFTTEWTRISRTFTTNNSEAGNYGEMSIIYDNGVTDYYVYFSGFQIEEKDHVTPYTPSTRNELVYDCSGYCNNGTITGSLQVVDDSPRYRKSTKINKGQISCLNPISNNIHTVSFWMKTLDWTPSDNNYYVINAGNGWFIYRDHDSPCRYTLSNPSESSARYSSIPITNKTEWNHICTVSTGSLSKIYVNGTLMSADNISLKNWGVNLFIIGPGYDDCILSDVRLYSTALSDDDIKELYNTSAIINNNNTLEAYEFVE